MGAKAIKLGSWDKHPAYCQDLNVSVWHIRNRNDGTLSNVIENIQ